MRWIGWFLGALWRFSRRSWVTVHEDLRPRSPASGLYLFLFLLFFVIGLVLMLLGVNLGSLDRWLESHAGLLDSIASRLFNENHVVEARLDADGRGLLVRTRNAEHFYLLLNRLAGEGWVEVEAVVPADEDVQAVYQYLIGSGSPGGNVAS